MKKLEIINIIKEELSLLTEAKVKKGDVIYDKSYDEYGVVNKVKGRVAYIKFQSTGAKSFDPVLVSDIKYKGKHKGKDLYVTEAICADQSHRYEKEESVAPDHDGKAAPYGSGYDKVNEDYSQRARNFRVALRRRLASMKKGKKIKYGKLTFTALGNGNFKDSKGKTVPSENIVQTMKFAVQSDIMQHRGAAGDDMVNAYLKFEGKVNEISVPAKFSDEVFKVPPSKMNREHVLKVAKKYNVDPKLAIQYVNQVGRLKLKEGKEKWTLYVDKAKLKTYNSKRAAVIAYNKILDSQQMQHITSVKITKEGKLTEAVDMNDPFLVAVRVMRQRAKEMKELDALAKKAPKKRAPKISFDKYLALLDSQSNIQEDIEDVARELKQTYSDMEQEAGQKGDKWTDKDANRYGGILNKLESKYAKLKAKKSKIDARVEKYRMS